MASYLYHQEGVPPIAMVPYAPKVAPKEGEEPAPLALAYATAPSVLVLSGAVVSDKPGHGLVTEVASDEKPKK